MSTTFAYDFTILATARDQLSQALANYESACDSLDLINFQHSALPKFSIQTFFSTIEHERELLARETLRALRLSAKLDAIRNRSAIAVPVGRLPPEMLSTIFTMAADSTRSALTQAPNQADELPEIANVISSVCSHWRRVALDTPALWAHIDLNRKGGLSHAALWLDRARSYPLHVSSNLSNREGLDQEWIALLKPHSYHFHSLILDLDFVGQSIFHNACAHHVIEPLRLDYLALSFDSDGDISVWEVNLLPSEMQGLLGTHSIHLDNVSLGSLSSPAFQGLYHLCLDGLTNDSAPSLKQIFEVLRSNPNLQYFELSRAHFDIDTQLDIPLVTMNKLETLRLGCLQARPLQWLLGHLVLRPTGVTLVLFRHMDVDEDRIGVGLGVLSNHSITTLCFLSPMDGPSYLDLNALLIDLPCLETLSLEHIFFKVDKCPVPAKRQYPSLSNLSLVSTTTIDFDSFMDMVVNHSVRHIRIFDSDRELTREFVLDRAPDIEFSEAPGSSVPPTWRPFD